jgi:acyl carrier protein
VTTTKKLNEIFQQVFDDDSIEVNPQMTADDVDGWDSLSHINLIIAVEATFNIRFSQKELLSFKNVGDLMNCIDRKIAS